LAAEFDNEDNVNLLGYGSSLRRLVGRPIESTTEATLRSDLLSERYFDILRAYDLNTLKNRKPRLVWMVHLNIRTRTQFHRSPQSDGQRSGQLLWPRIGRRCDSPAGAGVGVGEAPGRCLDDEGIEGGAGAAKLGGGHDGGELCGATQKLSGWKRDSQSVLSQSVGAGITPSLAACVRDPGENRGAEFDPLASCVRRRRKPDSAGRRARVRSQDAAETSNVNALAEKVCLLPNRAGLKRQKRKTLPPFGGRVGSARPIKGRTSWSG
jgi:hypothetical protein